MKSSLLILLSLVIITTGCKNEAAPDVSSIKVSTAIIRTEQDLQRASDIADITALTFKYPAFYKIYMDEILGFKGTKPDSQIIDLQSFIKDTLVNDIIIKTNHKYPDFSKIKSETDQMFRFLTYYFPDKSKHLPDIYTFVSEFGYQIFIFEDDSGRDGIGLGLDMFLHPDVDYKMIDPDNTNFSDYVTRSWNKDHIVKKIADLYITDILGDAPGHRMIDQMVHNGKALYLTKLLMPATHDSVITEYPLPKLEWCENNELEMWSFFLDNKLFYESNPAKIGKYLNPSPDSPEMPPLAPGRTANYMGWQIVKAYMQRYPDTTPAELIALNDAQLFLEKSKYKPSRK
ncbi:MAG: hypothetical protein IPL55_19125 [Saprospiraceae bacterium]|jgi:hypothetical protein|nr:hypothetical protein [Saprospiraceae bacterium]